VGIACGTEKGSYIATAAEVSHTPAGFAVDRLVVAFECGAIVNPDGLHNQVEGSIVQGLGGAFMEDLVYDNNGQLLTGNLADYLIPTATDIPNIRAIALENHQSPSNPLGVKGAGEGGTIPAPAAIIAAIEDALSPFGVRFAQMPLTPDRIVAALRDAGAYRKLTAVATLP